MPRKTNTLKELNQLVATQIMGISLEARTDADIGEAVMKAMRGNSPKKDGTNVMTFDFDHDNSKEYELSYEGSKYCYKNTDGNDGYGLWFWEQRHGKDYQKAIEKHVMRWKRPVRDYAKDLNDAMDVAEKVKLFDSYTVMKKGDEWWVFALSKYTMPINEASIAMGLSLAEAICRGSLVLKVKQDEQANRSNQLSYSGLP